ncbi:hypothetical protein HG535_0H02860 [Zygotorulaspora mrakii]|uniref:GYF domain-containing protein n=1 Tax=Zygotorulaspora mrakii TaxID=42260 RepID=A0A7H9BAB0_ZYGMR|nr:uncharacterized protein HG535_0H02860 [Zygotorulaspora mrakii]QLG74959.1 hypothetical protein HG535_0H02860 [Zygotorulaspora mrakii]
MNFQSSYQDPLESMSYQLQNMAFERGVSGAHSGAKVSANGGVSQPLSRTGSSLVDSMAAQRSSSPFVAHSQVPGQILGQASGGIPQARESVGVGSVGIAGGFQGQGAILGGASGPPNGWTQSANGSSVSSPYTSQLGQTNLYTGGSPHFQNLPMPAGMPQSSQPVIIESQWKYFDTQGQIQGPFSSNAMSQWYASGYFQPSLQIARQGPTPEPFGINDRFIMLAELISRVNDFHDPFLSFDRIISSNSMYNLGASLVGHHNAASTLQSSIQPNHSSAVANVESDDFTHDEILQLKDKDGGYYHEVLVQIPASRKNEQKLDQNVEVDTSVVFINEGITEIPRKEKMLEASTSQVDATSSEMKQNSTIESSEKIADKNKQKATSRAKVVVSDAKDINSRRQQKAEEMARKLVEEQEKQEREQNRKEELRKLKKQQKQKTKESDENSVKNKSKTTTESMSTATTVSSKSSPEESQKGASVITAPVAPWAHKAENADTTKISIPELQKKEEIEQARRNQERELKERAVALKIQDDILKQEKADNELKSKLTWANKPAPPAVTIDIKAQSKRKAELESANKIKSLATANSNSSALNELNDPNFIKQQKKLWEEAQRSNSKPTTSNPSSSSNKMWTTVPSKSSNNNTNREAKITNQPKSYISPDKLRAVSVTSNKQIGSSTSIPSLKSKYSTPMAYPGNSSIALRQEFLRWCKSQMKLSPNVSSTSVLEVLLSLPAGPDAKEIIADTIYSNSSTMDGRRFALEFIKKRIECEKQIKDPLTWSEALALPEGEQDDWEFQIVSKKKGRKH